MRLKSLFLAAIAANLVLFASCEKYDDGEIKQNIAAIDNRVTALEGKVTTLEGAMSALQTVVERNYSITNFVKTDDGYKLTFTTGETLELLNGEKGDKGDKGDTGDSFFKSVTQQDGFIVIVMNDSNNTTYTIPCTTIKIGQELTSTSIEVKAGQSNDIEIDVPALSDIAGVTATVTYGNGIASDTRAAITEWKVVVAEDYKKVTVEVPADAAEGFILLQVIAARKDGTTYTASKKLSVLESCLKLTALEDGSTITIPLDETMYKTSTQGWTEYTASDVITLNKGEFVQFKAAAGSTRNVVNKTFVMTGSFAASGNVMSLLGENQEMENRAFRNLFYQCKGLTAAPELPATTLASNCYFGMFQGTNLTTAPELPATTLASGCYSGMFSHCTSLKTAPELPATTLASQCYMNMFTNCTSLTTASELPATTLAQYCYANMFRNCTALTEAPELPATTLAEYCYYDMFFSCEGLTTAPALPATTLIRRCYSEMFANCINLKSVTVSFTEWNPTDATTNWLTGVAATGTFTCPSALTETIGKNYIPEGWTVVK